MTNCACFTRYRTQFLSVFLALFRGARAKDGSRELGRRTASYEPNSAHGKKMGGKKGNEPNSAHKKKKGAAGERCMRDAGGAMTKQQGIAPAVYNILDEPPLSKEQ